MDAEAIDEIHELFQARYLSASEAAWSIFGFHVNQREPSVSALPAHIPGEDFLLFSTENAERVLATTVSMLDRYLSRPAVTMFDDVMIMSSSWCLVLLLRIGGTKYMIISLVLSLS